MSEEFQRARSYILDLLARRDYPRSTLERKLRLRKLPKDQIKSLLDELVEKGLLREKIYVAIRTRELLRRGEGARNVRARLRQQRCEVGSEEIQSAYEILGESPEEILRKVLRKTLDKTLRKSGLSQREVEQKVLSALIRKGHDASLIRKVLQQELAERRSEVET